jgi:glucose-fructose oxidoreductase
MPQRTPFRIAGINFDFRHMDHLLAYAFDAPNAEVVGICHDVPGEMQDAIRQHNIPDERVFADWDKCIESTRPDLVILCPSNNAHADWIDRVAPYRVHVLMEKPFAANLEQADRMIAAMKKARRRLAINWPLAWYPPHVTAHRLLTEGRIGRLQEVHFFDGNRSPIWDRANPDAGPPTTWQKNRSWFYDPVGGGALIDYLGYGATLATWYFGGKKPSEITAVTAGPAKLPVEEQSVTIARYGEWLSTFHTRWGTFTDPWEHQPQPKCGFVLKGTEGTIANYDYEDTVRIQTTRRPSGQVMKVDKPRRPLQNPVQYFLHCLETGKPIRGPISPAYSRIGQQIVDTAAASARLGKTLSLIDR